MATFAGFSVTAAGAPQSLENLRGALTPNYWVTEKLDKWSENVFLLNLTLITLKNILLTVYFSKNVPNEADGRVVMFFQKKYESVVLLSIMRDPCFIKKRGGVKSGAKKVVQIVIETFV